MRQYTRTLKKKVFIKHLYYVIMTQTEHGAKEDTAYGRDMDDAYAFITTNCLTREDVRLTLTTNIEVKTMRGL